MLRRFFFGVTLLLNLYYGALANAPHFSVPPLVSDIGLGVIALLISLEEFLLRSGWITDLVIAIGYIGWISVYFGVASWLTSAEVFSCPFVMSGIFSASAAVKGIKSYKNRKMPKV